MAERNDWMVVYRQGKARSVKIAMRWLSWEEAHEVAGKIVEVNSYFDDPSDHFQAWYVTEDATSVIDEEAAYRKANRRGAIDWNSAPRLPIKRGK